MDVLVTRASESVAIEVETGKSDALANVRSDLLAGYDRVLVVATSDQAWVRVWRALQRAGLAIPRVTLVLQDAAKLGKHDDARTVFPGRQWSA